MPLKKPTLPREFVRLLLMLISVKLSLIKTKTNCCDLDIPSHTVPSMVCMLSIPRVQYLAGGA